MALVLALLGAGFTLVALTALFGYVRGPRVVHDVEAGRRRMLRELAQYEDRTRAELREGRFKS